MVLKYSCGIRNIDTAPDQHSVPGSQNGQDASVSVHIEDLQFDVWPCILDTCEELTVPKGNWTFDASPTPTWCVEARLYATAVLSNVLPDISCRSCHALIQEVFPHAPDWVPTTGIGGALHH